MYIAAIGRALSIVLAIWGAGVILVLARIGGAIGLAGGQDGPTHSLWLMALALWLVPMAACYFAFSRCCGRLGASARLSRPELYVYALVGLAGLLVVGARSLQVISGQLPVTVAILMMLPILLLLAVWENRNGGAKTSVQPAARHPPSPGNPPPSATAGTR